MTAVFENGNILVPNIKNFDLEQTLDCGQAFRWECEGNGVWRGIAYGKPLRLSIKDNTLILYNTLTEDYENIWRDYFDLERDYSEIVNSCQSDTLLSAAAKYGEGIRILRQEPWEALCSFIISQNNNIPRIKGIIERLCMSYGEKIEGGYTFPSASVIAALSLEDLANIRSGFRAKYILDAAQKVASGEIELEVIQDMDYTSAKEYLMKIKGVGSKVADCTLLFGFSKIDAFPKDVWIKKVMDNYFPNGLPAGVHSYGGVIQQYLFFYARSGELELK